MLRPAENAAAAISWRMKAAEEVRSHDHFAALLSAAPTLPWLRGELTTEIARIVADEQRHAELCRRMSCLFQRDVNDDVPIAASTEPPLDAAAAARTVVIEMAVGEMVSASLFARARSGAREVNTRAALTEILRDEVRHARVGWQAAPKVLSMFARDWWEETIAVGLGAIEQHVALPALLFLKEARAFDPEWIRLGIIPPEVRVDTFYRCIEHTIFPRLTALGFDGAALWRQRYSM